MLVYQRIMCPALSIDPNTPKSLGIRYTSRSMNSKTYGKRALIEIRLATGTVTSIIAS
jgi:hypothetical protein